MSLKKNVSFLVSTYQGKSLLVVFVFRFGIHQSFFTTNLAFLILFSVGLYFYIGIKI